jgi:protein SCO1
MNALRTTRIAAWAAVVLVIAGVAGALYWKQNQGAAAFGGPFTLTDQTGATVTEATLKGHPSAMFFGYTHCPDVCPTTLYDMTTRLEELGPDADKLKVYFVTIDPERDTKELMATYLSAFDPRITGLTGTREQVDQIIKDYHVFARKVPRDDGGYLMDHTATVYLLDKDANFTGTLDYQEDEKTALAKLKRLVGRAS